MEIEPGIGAKLGYLIGLEDHRVCLVFVPTSLELIHSVYTKKHLGVRLWQGISSLLITTGGYKFPLYSGSGMQSSKTRIHLKMTGAMKVWSPA